MLIKIYPFLGIEFITIKWHFWYSIFIHYMNTFIISPITDNTINSIWDFYPEVIECKKHKKKCCKSYKKDKRCKKCPMNS